MYRKLALIIGNNDYQRNELKNCVNDANSLDNLLRNVNCKTTLAINLKSEEMYQCIRNFIQTLEPNDFVIFFFAGHALQWAHHNFLLPCDNKKIITYSDIKRYAINAQETLDEMSTKTPHFILMLLDCCREYCRPDSISRSDPANRSSNGLHEMIPRSETLIAFACASGQVAADQSVVGSNGIFTKYLLRHLPTPGLDIDFVLRKVARDVANETNNRQHPYRVSSVTTSEVYLVPFEEIYNILLIGEQGTGKSTFINAFPNYLSFPTIDHVLSREPIVLKPLSFHATLNETFEDRLCTFGDCNTLNPTSTNQCQTYSFNLPQDNRIKLCFIDTPSFDETQRPNQIKHILDYVDRLSHLNAICFLLQPDAQRLSTSFQSCFGQLMTRLGLNAQNKVMFCFTNALMTFSMPGNTAMLLRSMLESHSMQNMRFNRDNTFFFENESFRYLVAEQNGIRFSRTEKEEYAVSWSEAVNESYRFLQTVRARTAL